MINFDNFIKGPVTSLFGLCIMGACTYGWWIEWLTDWQGGIGFLIGFALLYMRDKLPDFIAQFISAVIDKFKSK